MKALSIDTNTAIPFGLVSDGHIESEQPKWAVEMARSLGMAEESVSTPEQAGPSIRHSSRHFIIPDVDGSIRQVDIEEFDQLFVVIR